MAQTRMWATLLQSSSSHHIVEDNKDQSDSDSETLLRQLDTNLNDENISNWLNEDVNDPGYQLLTDDEII